MQFHDTDMALKFFEQLYFAIKHRLDVERHIRLSLDNIRTVHESTSETFDRIFKFYVEKNGYYNEDKK